MTRELLKELDKQPSSPDLDELREKFRIVKVRPRQGAPAAPSHSSDGMRVQGHFKKCFWLQVPCCCRITKLCTFRRI